MDWVDFFRTQSREFTVTRGLKSVSGEALPEWWETSSWLTERLRCPSPDCWARASSLPFNEQFEHRLYIYFSINDPRGKPRAHAHSEPWFPSGAELLLECLVTNKNVTVLLGKWVMTERLKDTTVFEMKVLTVGTCNVHCTSEMLPSVGNQNKT